MNLTVDQAQDFLTKHSTQEVTAVVPLSGGEWSQAFGFKRDGKDYVVRFGENKDDYLRDQLAVKYSAADLPIPKVLEVGDALDGCYAISERAFGIMLDRLERPALESAMPSLFNTMDAIREADISGTTGYGTLQINGNGNHTSWASVLLDVANDRPSQKIHGWRDGLEKSPVGIEPFEKAYDALIELAQDLPVIRTLVHNDLLNNNVLVYNDEISGVIDWANALYGDFLYDLAQFTFWEPIYEPIKGIDWESAALKHYESIGLEVPAFKQRLNCCMVNMGLGAQCYYGFTKNWTYLEAVAKRTLKLAKKGK
jgi:hygromycin-B 4-O-kinase